MNKNENVDIHTSNFSSPLVIPFYSESQFAIKETTVFNIYINFDMFLNAIEHTLETLHYKTTKENANSIQFIMNNIIFYNHYANGMTATNEINIASTHLNMAVIKDTNNVRYIIQNAQVLSKLKYYANNQ